MTVFNDVFKLLVEKASFSLHDDHLKIVNELFRIMINFIDESSVSFLLKCIIDRGILNKSNNKAYETLRDEFLTIICSQETENLEDLPRQKNNFFNSVFYKLIDVEFEKIIILHNKTAKIDNAYSKTVNDSRERLIATKSKRFRKKYGDKSKNSKIRDKEFQTTKINEILERLDIIRELSKLCELKHIVKI